MPETVPPTEPEPVTTTAATCCEVCKTPPNLAGMHWDGSYTWQGERGYRDFEDGCPWGVDPDGE